MSFTSEYDTSRFLAKQRHFNGSARIELNKLDFTASQDPSASSYLDPKNVARLARIFSLEGCLRLDLDHHVPALVSDAQLQQALIRSHVEAAALANHQSPPLLIFPESTILRCLHGKHRIAAARSILEPGDKWWTVDLYSDGLEETVQKDIREDYANSRNFCDGDIYRYLRQCDAKGDKRGRKKWLARLSECKRKDLLHFLEKEHLEPLVAAFDRLLPFVGFWPSLQLGTFHRLLSLKCPEELCRYLDHIHVTWEGILEPCGPTDCRPLVDIQTVECLQMRAPRLSVQDRVFITQMMHEESIFAGIKNATTRAEILCRILNIGHLIPSLHTFIEDTKWLEPCAKVLRTVFGVAGRGSIDQAIRANYEGSEHSTVYLILNRDLTLTKRQGSIVHAINFGIKQLWMFAWRCFPELSGVLPRKDAGERKPFPKAVNQECWRRFSQAAADLGFTSASLKKMQCQDPDTRMVRQFIGEARPDEFYDISDGRIVGRIADILKMVQPKQSRIDDVGFSSTQEQVPLKNRCGRPFTLSLDRVKRFFYAEDIYTREVSIISDFCVHRDIFFAFFGRERPSKVDMAPADENTPASITVTPEQAGSRQKHPHSAVVNGNADANVEVNVPGQAGHNAEHMELDHRTDSIHPLDPTRNMDWESITRAQTPREPVDATAQPIQSGERAEAKTGEGAVESTIFSNRIDMMDPGGRLARELDQALDNALKGDLILVDLVAHTVVLLRSDFHMTKDLIAKNMSMDGYTGCSFMVYNPTWTSIDPFNMPSFLKSGKNPGVVWIVPKVELGKRKRSQNGTGSNIHQAPQMSYKAKKKLANHLNTKLKVYSRVQRQRQRQEEEEEL